MLFTFRYELDPDDGYISKIISGVFRTTKNRSNQQKGVPQRQLHPQHLHDKHLVPKYTEPSAVYRFSTNSYELGNVPIDENDSTSGNSYRNFISSQNTRQHLTETTQIQAPALVPPQYHRSPVKNQPYDVLIEDYADSTYKSVPQTLAKVNPIITYTQNLIGEDTVAVAPTDNPLIGRTTETNSIRNRNNTFLSELLQKLHGPTQHQSQLTSSSDNVEVDYSIISLFKILNDFKRTKEIIGSSPDHQHYVQSGANDALDENIDNSKDKPVKGLRNIISIHIRHYT